MDDVGPAEIGVRIEDRFTPVELETVHALERGMHAVHVRGATGSVRQEVRRLYLNLKARVAERVARFGLVNNRIFVHDDRMMVPYLVGDTLIVHRVDRGGSRPIERWRFPVGTLITDRLLRARTGFAGRAIDLEKEIYDLDVEQAVEIQLHRLRDMGKLLRRINELSNPNEAKYALRFLVAQLSSPGFRGFLGAKNLKPEIHNLVEALKEFVNSPIADRLPMLVRVLVRNVSGIVVRPGLIDSLWNDAIEINERLVRGSDIAIEIRRSTHHSLGDRTLRLTRAYRQYLETGDATELGRHGYPHPSAADEAARSDAEARQVVDRMVNDLEKLLGTAEVREQIGDWQAGFLAALFECDTDRTVGEEIEEALAALGGDGNRWTFLYHLRAVRRRLEDLAAGWEPVADLAADLDRWLDRPPGTDGFDADDATHSLRALSRALERRLTDAYVDPIVRPLEAAFDAYAKRAFLDAADRVHTLRRDVAKRIRRPGFHALRYHLFQLDCLLEKMSYLALRHVATDFEERGVQLRQCLEIINGAIQNLANDGLYSREVADLAGMLTDGDKSYGELSNVMESLQRNYHKSLHLATVPFERMQDRLGFGDVELRITLANMQRYMHDHNTMVNFCDLARTFIRQQPDHRALTRGGAPEPDREAAYDFLHLSDRERIRRVVEEQTAGPNVAPSIAPNAAPNVGPNLRERYGGKGSGLIYLGHLNIPTRDGFILPTILPRAGLQNTDRSRFRDEIGRHLRRLEADVAARARTRVAFGDPARPLLLAIRGGSVFSMPGILSTVVFAGMNDEIAAGLARDDPWHAYDSYRRFLASFAMARWGFDLEAYGLVTEAKSKHGVALKEHLPWRAMRSIAETSKAIVGDAGYAEELERCLRDPTEQLFASIESVLNSWNRLRAQRYREIKGVCHTWQTAAIVQQMACGNFLNDGVGPGMDETRASLTGVIPRSELSDWGVRRFIGDIKFSAAGDDLVGGVTSSKSFQAIDALATLMPMLHRRLKHILTKIIRFMGADQEIEFTVERGVLSVLQARAAEMGADQQGAPFEEPGEAVTRGIGIRGGGFRGRVAFDDDDRRAMAVRVERERDDGIDGVLVVIENPTPDDIPLILSGDGLLTAKGGNTSHAAVAINGLDEKNFTAVMSAAGLKVTADAREASIHDADGRIVHRIRSGDVVSIHGTDGDVYLGSRPLCLDP